MGAPTALMSALATAARSALKAVVLRAPFGARLQTLYRRRKFVRDLQSWTPDDEAALRFYSQFMRPGDVCFDIGANRGLRTKIFRRLGAKVVAVEPQSSCMAVLRSAYRGDARVALVQAACGAASGSAVLHVSETDVLSSLSDEWMNAVTQSGRFTNGRWNKQESCALVTLDELVRLHGEPSFIKVDVEGYELNALQGLSRPVRYLSFEFTPERFDIASACLQHLSALGMSEFNVSWNESLRLELDAWVGFNEIAALLGRYREDHVIFGDVYARRATL